MVFPLTAFAFGEAALVSFFAGLAVSFFSEATFFGFGEDFSRSLVEVGFACEGGANAFFEELKNFDTAFVGVVWRGDLKGVADFQGGAGFEVFAGAFDFSDRAIV